MTTNSIENIYNDYRATIEYPLKYTLDFFAKNALFLDNLDTFKDDNELRLYMQLACQHLNALYKKDRFNETVENAIKYLKTINSKIDKHNLASIKNDWYYEILFFKGLSTYQLRDYKTSTSIFQQLIEYNSKNEGYKNWLCYSKHMRQMWFSKIIKIVCGLLFLITFFLEQYIQSSQIQILLESISLIGLIGTLIYDYYTRKRFIIFEKNLNQVENTT